MGDSTHFDDTLKSVNDAIADLGKKAASAAGGMGGGAGGGRTGAGAGGAGDDDFERIFHNYRLLEKSKQILFDRDFQNLVLLDKQRQIAFDKEFQDLVLLAKAKQVAFDKEFQNEVLSQKIKDLEFERELQNEILLEKQRTIAAEKAARDKKAAQDAYIRDVKWNSKLLEDQMKREQQLRDEARAKYMKDVKWNSKLLEDQHKADVARQQQSEKQRIASQKVEFDAQLSRIRREIKEAEKAEREKIRAAEKAEKEKVRLAREAEREKARIAKMSMRSGMGDGLTSRADIYMHVNAIRALTQSGKGMLDVYANFMQAKAGIEVFTKDAQKANDVMAELMDYAKTTPFSIAGISEETKNMMARGVAVDLAVDSIKRLGMVSGGSQERLNRLSLAFSQIMTKGKLMQQDLNQLAEQGFNPLATIARASLKPNQQFEDRLAEVTRAKEQGLVTSKHFLKALEMETSQGGYYANLLNRMSKEVGGLTSRLKEMFLEMKLDVMAILDEQLKTALKSAIMYVGMLHQWIKNNKEAAKRIVEFGVKVLAAVVAFHALGLAIATVRWWMTILMSIFRSINFVISPVIFMLRLLGTTGSLMASILVQSFRAVAAATRIYFSVTAALSAMLRSAWVASAAFTTSTYATAAAMRVSATAAVAKSGAIALITREYHIMRGMGIVTYIQKTTVALWASAYAAIAKSRALGFLRTQYQLLKTVGIVAYLRTITMSLWSGSIASVRWAAGMVASTTASAAAGLAMRGAVVAMTAFKIAAVAGWLAFLGPISLAFVLIGGIVTAIWAAVNAISGAGGLSGAFASAFENLKWFFSASYGFFYNFAENAGIIAKYVYENWRSLFSDLGKIIGGFLMAVPGNILIMWRMGLRLTVAFGTWLITYLPTAIKNAFSAAMTFVKDVFMRILDAGKRVWKFITTPSEWGKGTKAITNFMNTLSGDVAKTREDGFYEAAKTIITEETSKMKTGLEGVQFTSPELQLNLKVPEAQKPPEPPELVIPEAPTDAAAMFAGIQPGAVGGAQGRGRDYQVQDAISAQSGDYTKKMAEYMDRMRGMKAATSDPKLQAQNKANQILQRIEKNTQQKPMEVAELDL
jgi:tape measure domain-containing protein